MNAEDKLKLAQAADIERGEPGMAAALLTVLVMIVTTAVLALLIYLIMVAIRPIEARHFKKAAEIERPVLHAHGHARPTS